MQTISRYRLIDPVVFTRSLPFVMEVIPFPQKDLNKQDFSQQRLTGNNEEIQKKWPEPIFVAFTQFWGAEVVLGFPENPRGRLFQGSSFGFLLINGGVLILGINYRFTEPLSDLFPWGGWVGWGCGRQG